MQYTVLIFYFFLLLGSFFSCLKSGELLEDEVPIVHSNALPSPGATSNVRFIAVYLPPQAAEDPNARFPVIYYFPGLFGDQNTFADSNAAIMDSLLSEQRITPIIIVNVDPSLVDGIDTDGKRRYAGTWYVNSELNHNFETFIVEDLIPYVDGKYPTKNSKEYRALAGQSMGGYGATWLGMKHPELFCGMGSASGTPFWSIITNVVPNVVDPGNPPGDTMFVVNSLVLPEIPTSGPDAGMITPDNGGPGSFTFSFFSYSGAFSSNVNKPPFFVNLPFLVDDDNFPIFASGSFTVANPNTGDRFTVPNSFIPNQPVIDEWKTRSPYIRAPEFQNTLTRQAIYLDGGDVELINAVGARQLSDQFVSLNVDHEYILYHGDHMTCLVDETCSRNQTIFQLFSAKFAEGGLFTDQIKASIIGTGTIELHDGCILQLTDHHILAVETNQNVGITNTRITFELFDSSQILLGTEDEFAAEPQGVLQVGNQFTKSTLEFNPSLKDHEISCTFIIRNGSINVQRGGFFGLGVGVNGFFPENINEWAISSLTNVIGISLQIIDGTFDHQLNSDSLFSPSLLALGPSKHYDFYLNVDRAELLGGGSLLSLPDGYLVQSISYNAVGKKLPGGIRNDLNRDPNAIDFFFQKPMGSTLFYEDIYDFGLLLSTSQLPLSGFKTPFAFNTTSQEVFFTRLAFFTDDQYAQLLAHQGIVTSTEDGEIEIAVLDDNGNIVRFSENEIPNPDNLDLFEIANTVGSVDVVSQTINGVFTLLRIDNSEI